MSRGERLLWVPDDHDVWTLAAQISDELPNGCVNVLIQKNQKVVAHQLGRCLPASRDGNVPEDLVYLQDVNQGSILHCIRTRFTERKIYTSIGMVLMTLNPFEVIGGLYGKAVIKKYEDPMDRNQNSHVYSIPSRAYYDMCNTGEDQSILISGESGAGKTEAAKHCLAFLTEVANERAAAHLAAKLDSSGLNDSREDLDGSVLSITEIASRIIAASPILESFGNAKTSRNPNSSRFGKWMVLNFDRHNVIHSASIVSYLLEKSRVTQREPQERAYHIFYQLLRGLPREQLKAWKLVVDTRQYRYLAAEGLQEAVDLNDGRNYKLTYDSFIQMGFTQEETMHFFRIVVAILLIGNIDFIPIRDGEGTEIRNMELVEDLSEMLGVSGRMLAFSLCNRSFETGKTRKSIVHIQLNVQKAVETRDSLARSLYERLFTEVINAINVKSKISSHPDGHGRLIGLLDIFGFEIFTENSFEQLCINYCNEMLQHHFDYVIFTAEKNLYSEEGIVCETIEFKDNSEMIRDIELVFKALDEESRVPKGSARQWYEKMKKAMKTPHVTFPPRRKGDIFLVKHYAGDVEYSPNLFLEKNVETLNNDLVGAMSSSTDPIMMRLFARTAEDVAKLNDMNTSGGGRKQTNSTITSKSLSWKFIQQLGTLMGMLRKTHSHFIRCVKSNEACMAQRFEAPLVYKQLLYSGVFEVVKIQQSGLPCRLPHMDFLARYKCLTPSRQRWQFRSSQELLNTLIKQGLDLSQARVGSTQVFFKSFEQKLLEVRRDSLQRKSASKFTCFLMKIKYSRAFQFVIEAYRRFRVGNEELSSVVATPAFRDFQAAVVDFHRLCQRAVLQHVVLHMERELSLLDQRVELITDATQRLAERSKQSICSLEEVLQRAVTLEITAHPVIEQCRQTSEDYYRTIRFVDVVHRSDPGGGSQYTTTLDTSSSDVLRSLTSVDIESGVALLQAFSTVVDDASVALHHATHYLHAVQSEVHEVGEPLHRLLEMCKLCFDAEAGIMVHAHGEEAGRSAFIDLKQTLEAVRDRGFHSTDVENLYLDAVEYVSVIEEHVVKGDAVAALQVMTAATQRRPVGAVFAEQVLQLQPWAEIQQSPEKLRALLIVGFVPGSQTGGEAPVVYDEIEQLVDNLKNLTKPTMAIQGVIRAGEWIVQLRREYLNQRWDDLERVVADADQDGVENHVFEEYPDCVTELNHCQWQVIYHGFLTDVLDVVSASVFRSVTMDSDSWHVMIVDVNEDLSLVNGVKNYLAEDLAPRLYSLLPLLEHVVHLRSLTYSRETDIASAVVQLLRENYQDVCEDFQLTAAIQSELTACEKLLQKIVLENQLLAAMRLCKAIVYPPESGDLNTQPAYVSYCQLGETVTALQQALTALKDFAPKYDTQLEGYMSLARRLLYSREQLAEKEDTNSSANKDWKKVFDSYQQQEEETGQEAWRETPVYFEFEEELQIVPQELHRRYILTGLMQLLRSAAVVGQVDVDVRVEEAVLRKHFASFNVLMKDMKEHAFQYPKNLQYLAVFVKAMLKFRQKILDKQWQKEDLESFIQYMSTMPHGGGYQESVVQQEVQRVKAELQARQQIHTLRRALETIQVQHCDEDDNNNNSNSNNANASDSSSSSSLNVNLAPLKAAIAAVDNYQGVSTKKLVKLAKQIVHIVEVLLQNSSTRIEDTEIEAACTQLKDLQLDATNVDMVFDNVRVHNFMKNIRDALVKHVDHPDTLLSSITYTRQSIKHLPKKYIPWLKVAYLFADVSLSLVLDIDWVRLVETTRKLDEFLQFRIMPAVETEQRSSHGSGSNWNDIVRFVEVITQLKVRGYQVALQRKKQLDEAEQQQRTSNLSPVEAQKEQLRHDDLAQNAYGLGALRKAGFSDKKLSELSFDGRLFWAYDFDVGLLRKRKWSAVDLLHAGYTVSELYRGGYTVLDLYQNGVALAALELTPKELAQAGLPLKEIVVQLNLNPDQVHDLERDPRKLLASGMTLSELVDAGFSLLQLRGTGFDAAALYHAGFDRVHDFLAAGYDVPQIANIFPLQELRRAGISYAVLKGCGYGLEALVNAGYIPEVEKEVLFQFFDVTGGHLWTSRRFWKSEKPIGEWEGIVVDEAGRVIAIDLVEHNVRGALPVELCLLRKLQSLHLAGNEQLLSARIPAKLVQFLQQQQVLTDVLGPATSLMEHVSSTNATSQPSGNQTLTRRVAPPPPPPLPSTPGAQLNTPVRKNSVGSSSGRGGVRGSADRRRSSFTELPVFEPCSDEEELAQQRVVLMEVYHALQGTGWLRQEHWGSDAPLGRWFGVKVNSAGFVTELVLASNRLRGILPSSLGRLQHLQLLDLRLNQIHGVVPASLGQCLSLQSMYLQSNKLIGLVPETLTHLSLLQIVDVRNNLLEGHLPLGLANLPNLKYLGLHSNRFVQEDVTTLRRLIPVCRIAW